MSKVNMRVEFESTPIRHIAVQCPDCGRWFYGNDITDDDLHCKFDLHDAMFHCPFCENTFGYHKDVPSYDTYRDELNIIETGYSEVYKDVLKKKVKTTYE